MSLTLNALKRWSQPAQTALFASAILGFGCEDASEPSNEPPKSRVQAVVQSSTATPNEPAAKPPKPTGPTIGSGSQGGSKTPSQPRGRLCAGEISDPGAPFNPKRAPEQRGAQGANPLPEEPITGKGKRWTWVNFWAAWCAPCKEELPVLLEWQRKLEGQVDFAFISFDDDERQLDGFLKEQPGSGLTRSYWLPDGPARMAWLKALNLEVEPELPMQILLDPQGRWRCTVRGAIDPSDLPALESIVAKH